jgi:hypothetical protein
MLVSIPGLFARHGQMFQDHLWCVQLVCQSWSHNYHPCEVSGGHRTRFDIERTGFENFVGKRISGQKRHRPWPIFKTWLCFQENCKVEFYYRECFRIEFNPRLGKSSFHLTPELVNITTEVLSSWNRRNKEVPSAYKGDVLPAKLTRLANFEMFQSKIISSFSTPKGFLSENFTSYCVLWKTNTTSLFKRIKQ